MDLAVIQETINTHMSLKKISRGQEKLKRKPWMTKQILVDTRKQSSTFKSLLGNDSEKKKISKTLKQTEQNNSFCQKKVTSLKFWIKINNVKKTRQILQYVLPTTTNKIPAITINEQNPKTAVNFFNSFVCIIRKKLAGKILDNKNRSFLNYLSNWVSQSTYLKAPELNVKQCKM